MPESKKRHKHAERTEDADHQQAQPAQGAGSDAQPAMEAAMEMVPATDLDQLRQDLEQCQAKSAEYFDGWQRERADFANYRRRIEREQTQVYQNAVGNVVKKYLVVLDDLDRALKARPATGEAASWAEGIELIYRKLQSVLEAEGVHRMPAEQEMFNPNRHEAITQEESPDHQSGQVIEVVQPGYLIGDRVLRPALVRVAR